MKRRTRGRTVRERPLERIVDELTLDRTAPMPTDPGLVPVAAVPEAVEAQEVANGRRYVAVVSEVPGVEVFAERQPTRGAAVAARRGTDRYATDFPILIVAAALAALTFLPWYKGPVGFGLAPTGWQSGTWGPIIFFLGAGSFLLIALRRLGVHISLPVEESLIHEGAGWIALVGAVLKSRILPGPAGLLHTAYGAWIAIGAAAVLIVLAGRMSPHAPLVFRPGWYKARAGLVGAVVLGVMVAGSAVFGALNDASLDVRPAEPGRTPGLVQGRVPDCAKNFPLISGLRPQIGFGPPSVACQVQLFSAKSSAAIIAEFRPLLKSKGWTPSSEEKRPPSTWILAFTKPRCGNLVVVPAEGGSTVIVSLTPCLQPTSSPARP